MINGVAGLDPPPVFPLNSKSKANYRGPQRSNAPLSVEMTSYFPSSSMINTSGKIYSSHGPIFPLQSPRMFNCSGAHPDCGRAHNNNIVGRALYAALVVLYDNFGEHMPLSASLHNTRALLRVCEMRNRAMGGPASLDQ